MEDGRNGQTTISFDTSYAKVCGLNSLFKRCSVQKFPLAYWLSIPEFVDELMELKRNGVWITDETLLDAMWRFYNNQNDDEFRFRIAKQAINQLERAISQRQSSPS